MTKRKKEIETKENTEIEYEKLRKDHGNVKWGLLLLTDGNA